VQEQPIKILAALLEQPGQIVSREDLQRRLWPDGTFVDFEQSLNKAVNKLRDALRDSADHPIYVETLSRRGYRFLAPVEHDRTLNPVAETAAPRGRITSWLAAAGFLTATVLGAGLWPIDVPQVERVVQLTNDTTLKVGIGRLIPTGNRVMYGDGNNVWSVPASGGKPKSLSLPFLQNAAIKVLADYSLIRQQILLGSLFTGKSYGVELWLAGTDGEAPHKIGEFPSPSRGALSPDAERIAFSTAEGIDIQSIRTGERKRVHSMTGMSPMLWWHPSGHSVGFLDPPDDQQKARVWQVNDDGTHLRRVVPETERGQGQGAWSQDGKRFFYLGGDGEVFLRVEAGIVGWLRKSVVTRLTASGQFRTPPSVDPVNPRRLYAVGSLLRGETMRYDRQAGRWVSFLGGFSGEKIDLSPPRRVAGLHNIAGI